MPPPPPPNHKSQLSPMEKINAARARALVSPYNTVDDLNVSTKQASPTVLDAPDSIANVAETGTNSEPEPATAYKNPDDDVFLFNDPTLRTVVEDFFGVKASHNPIIDLKLAPQQYFNNDASYTQTQNDLPPYKAANDDLQVFNEKKHNEDTRTADEIFNETIWRKQRENE